MWYLQVSLISQNFDTKVVHAYGIVLISFASRAVVLPKAAVCFEYYLPREDIEEIL